MLNEYIIKIDNNEDIRKTLSDMRGTMREVISAAEGKKAAEGENINIRKEAETVKNGMSPERITSLLKHEDPKVRKNIMLLIPELYGLQKVSDVDFSELLGNECARIVWNAYQSEETLFVKSAYLKALSCLPCDEFKNEMHDLLVKMQSPDIPEEEQKHIRQERKVLEEILMDKGELVAKHLFTYPQTPKDVLLVTDEWCKEMTAAAAGGSAKIVPRGVRFTVTPVNFKRVINIRTYKELLFYIPVRKGSVITPETAADVILSSKMKAYLEEMLGEGPYPFRLDICLRTEGATAKIIKKISADLEEKSKGMFINVPGDYEIEIRLFEKKDGSYSLFLKPSILADTRFAYRKYTEATSMNPVTAASVIAVCEPYFRLDAQVIDPMAGVGTLLAERRIQGPKCGDMYALDTFGKAVEEGRSNTKAAKCDVNYINRNYFDFTHDYPFDELITELPNLYGEVREEREKFYDLFFRKSEMVMGKNGMMFVVSDEEGTMKKQIRIHKNMTLVRQVVMDEKRSIYIIKCR